MINILIVEEDKEIIKGIKKHIESTFSDFKLTKQAQSIGQTINAIEEGQIQVVLINNKIQNNNGLLFFDKIIKSKPEIQIIIYNVELDQNEKMQNAMNQGLNDYIFKPLRTQEISKCLNNIRGLINAFAKKDENKKKILLNYHKMIPVFQDRFLIDLVHGHIENDQEAKRLIEYFDMKIQAPYKVLVVKVDHYDKLRLAFDEEEKQLFIFTICDIIKSAADDIDATIFINRYDEITVILGSRLDKERIIDLADKICNEVQKETVTTVTVGIGRVQENPTDIQVSYKQAKAAIRHSYYFGKGIPIHIDYVEQGNEITYSYPMKKEQLLIYEAIVGNKKSVTELLKSIFEILRNAKDLPKDLVPKIILNIVISINKHAQEQNINLQDFYTKHISVKEIMQKEKLDEAYEYILGILDTVCSYMQEIRNDKDAQLINKLTEYVNENYMKDINAYSAARAFNKNVSYINKLFVNSKKISFSDYVDRIRMDKAKELLESTEDDYLKIAISVGYNDEKYFLNLFNHIEGIPAAEYRKSNIRNMVPRNMNIYK